MWPDVLCTGVDGATGAYLEPPAGFAEIPRLALQGEPEPLRTRGLRPGISARDLAATGWGVVFAPETPSEVRRALRPLLRHRRKQAGALFRRLVYRPVAGPGLAARRFLERLGVGTGPVEPRKLPYYLLLVGPPSQIPYELQYQLDLQYAVGRLCFDRPEDYARYAAHVIAAETSVPPEPPRAVFFGPRHPREPQTYLTTKEIVEPVAAALRAGHPGWRIEAVVSSHATKQRLRRLLSGRERPALLFTAGHGVVFPRGDRRQRWRQGSLLCQNWPGPDAGAPLREHYFGGGDVPRDGLQGMVSFHFACFSAGTPRHDSFARLDVQPHRERRKIAARDFIGYLPQRLLQAGALAVIGHVDQAFVWRSESGQARTFESVLGELLRGMPVGAATECLGQRYGEIAAELADELERIRFGGRIDEPALASLWLAKNEAQRYVVLGDPAVRLGRTV